MTDSYPNLVYEDIGFIDRRALESSGTDIEDVQSVFVPGVCLVAQEYREGYMIIRPIGMGDDDDDDDDEEAA